MRLRVILVLMVAALCSRPALAYDMIAAGDALARWGAYGDADNQYRQAEAQAPARHLEILVKRLAVAEVLQQQGTAYELAADIERELGSAQPEIHMRLALARGYLAFRTGRVAETRRQFNEAENRANQLQSPAAIMARYICQTYHYLEHTLQAGRPTPADYLAAFRTAYEPITHVPLTQPFEPLDMMRAATWSRLWITRAVEYCNETYKTDHALAAEWFQVASDMANNGSAALLRRSYGGQDPEAGYVASDYQLDLAEGFSYNAQYAAPLLLKIGQGLQVGDGILARVSAAYHVNPTYIEQLRLWARYHRALGLVHAWLMGGRAHTADGDKALGEFDAAIAAYRMAQQPIDALDAAIWRGEAEVFHHGNGWPQSVDQHLEEAAAECSRLHYPLGLLVARYWQGKLRSQANDLAGAEQVLRESVATADKMIMEWGATAEGRAQMLENCRDLYELLVDVLIRQHKSGEALEVTERSRSQAQLANLDLNRVKARNPAVAQALEQVNQSRENTRDLSEQLRAEQSLPAEQRSQSRIQKLNGEIAHNQQEFYQAINQIKQSDPDYERLVSIRPTGFAKIQPHLPSDTALLQYLPAADKLYIFVATQKDLKIQAVPVDRASIEKDVHTVRGAIVRYSRKPGGGLDAASQEALQRLHQALIAPVEGDISDKSTLAIVPSGALYYLPFSALYDKGSYLIQRKAVVTLTALEILELMESSAKATPSSLLALGNPDGSLPGAQQEVTDLAGLFQNRQVFMQQQATKSCLSHVQAGTAVVHLATHGVLNSEDVNNSYLVMAGQGDQSRLTAGEIYGLNLKQVSLVTLSACQTALGEAQPGAEIATLAQAFSVAGSRSMLASLWSVSDRETRELMVTFYKTLLAGKSKVEALRSAQLALLGQPASSHPFYWAAFELVGDWR